MKTNLKVWSDVMPTTPLMFGLCNFLLRFSAMERAPPSWNERHDVDDLHGSPPPPGPVVGPFSPSPPDVVGVDVLWEGPQHAGGPPVAVEEAGEVVLPMDEEVAKKSSPKRSRSEMEQQEPEVPAVPDLDYPEDEPMNDEMDLDFGEDEDDFGGGSGGMSAFSGGGGQQKTVDDAGAEDHEPPAKKAVVASSGDPWALGGEQDQAGLQMNVTSWPAFPELKYPQSVELEDRLSPQIQAKQAEEKQRKLAEEAGEQQVGEIVVI